MIREGMYDGGETLIIVFTDHTKLFAVLSWMHVGMKGPNIGVVVTDHTIV